MWEHLFILPHLRMSHTSVILFLLLSTAAPQRPVPHLSLPPYSSNTFPSKSIKPPPKPGSNTLPVAERFVSCIIVSVLNFNLSAVQQIIACMWLQGFQMDTRWLLKAVHYFSAYTLVNLWCSCHQEEFFVQLQDSVKHKAYIKQPKPISKSLLLHAKLLLGLQDP